MGKKIRLSRRAKDSLLKSIAMFLCAVMVINSTITIMAHEPDEYSYMESEFASEGSEPSSEDDYAASNDEVDSYSGGDDAIVNDSEDDNSAQDTFVETEVYTDDTSLSEDDEISENNEISEENEISEGDEVSEDNEVIEDSEVAEDEEISEDEELEESTDDIVAVKPQPEEVCNCDEKCTADAYNGECPVCSKAGAEDDADAFLKDNCKGIETLEEEEEKEEEIEAEIVEVDNTVTVKAVCQADGEAIEGTESFEISVEGTVDVSEQAPEIEGYAFAGKASLESGDSVVSLKKETTEENEKKDVDGEEVVVKTTKTTSISYYNGSEWNELTEDTTVIFEYTEETEEEVQQSVVFTASFVDQDGNVIEGYTSKKLTFEDTLDLTQEPETIEDYEYVEAQINGTVVYALNKTVEEDTADAAGEEVITYSYSTDDGDIEVTEDTEVTLVYEATQQEEAAITLSIVDEEGKAIEGYAGAELPEFNGELAFNDPENAPVEVEGYLYKEAAIDGIVITALVKEAGEDEDAVSTYYYTTEDGKEVIIDKDVEITLTYEAEEVVVLVDATIIDEFGDEIADKYSGMDISKIFGNADELILDDPENPPVDKVSVSQGLFKKAIKYTYVKATIGNKIIVGLNREATKETAELKDSKKEYIYSYTTDGATWIKIKEDTTVMFEYSDGKKTVYTYEDANILVTATLQHANAIPDDAEFVVTPVTSASGGYNYDAYMEALNANADILGNPESEVISENEEKYTEENTLLYDIAFLAAPIGEDGEAVEGDLVEYQPAEGMVNISFVFKQSQLSEELGAEEAADITVVHLPLTDSVKESTATTADATGISASDINIEVVAESVSLNGGTDQADFCLSDFSVIAVVGNIDINLVDDKMTDYSLYNILNNYNYFVFGNATTGHTVGAVIVGGVSDMSAFGGLSVGPSAGPAPQAVPSYFKGEISSNHGAWRNAISNRDDLVLYLGTENYEAYKEIDLHDKFKGIAFTDDYVDFEAAKASIMSQINAINEGIHVGIDDCVSHWTGKKLELQAGNTYIIDSVEGIGCIDIIGEAGGNDTIVKILDTSISSFPRTLVNGTADDSVLGGNVEQGNGISITWVCPNATSITKNYYDRFIGHVVAPNATFNYSSSDYNGCFIVNELNAPGIEGHMHPYNGNFFTPAASGFKVSKTVVGSDGQSCDWPAGAEFTFQLTGKNGAPMPAGSNGDTKDIKVSSTATFGFGDISFDKAGTYEYLIKEVKGNLENVTYDTTQYEVTVTVSANGSTAAVDKIEYSKVKDEVVLETKTTNENQVFGFTNTYSDEKTFDMIIAKWWLNEKYEGLVGDLYPTNPTVSIQLYRNGEPFGDPKTISGPTTSKGEWDIEWNNLPGTPEEYTAKETTSFPGFTTMYDTTGNLNWEAIDQGGCHEYTFENDKWTKIIIANVYKPESVKVEGSKTWNDSDDLDGLRPDSITVHLNKTVAGNTTEVTSKVVTEADNWSWSFTDLPRYEKGQEVGYSITEDAVTGYTPTISGYNITNTHSATGINFSVSKKWEDANNQDGKRPNSVTVQLYANGNLVEGKTITLNIDNGWSGRFEKLPAKDANGKTIIYSVQEVAVSGYKVTVSGNIKDGFTITNHYDPEKISVGGSKTWNDNDNQDGVRPEEIKINLYADGKFRESRTVTEEDGWTWTFNNLPKYREGAVGQEIRYTITEDEVKGYTQAVEGYNVTNTHTPGKVGKTVQKVWVDGSNQDGLRPASIEVQLLADGKAYGDAVTLNEENGWSYSWSGLPEKQSGKAVSYTVKELGEIKGYATTYSSDSFTITNTHTPETVEVAGHKNWVDNNNQDGIRPTEITINLLADNTIKESRTVTEADDWKWTFNNLPKYANGEEIEYTITENTVAGYTSAVKGYNVINTHLPEQIEISGNKIWEPDEYGQEEIPESITIHLFAGEEELESKVVTAADGWKWSFTGLDKFKDGEKITYRITEDKIDDYSAEYVEGTYDVINRYTPDYTQISVTKEWDDADDQDGIRPDVIKVQLYAGLLPKGDVVELNEGNNWSYSWSNLPDKKVFGNTIYSVKEVDVPDDYKATTVISGTSTTIWNKYTPETVDVNGTKTWDDANNQDGIRPISITINLYADGSFKESKTVTEADGWSWEFEDLPKFNKGVEIVYTISEEKVDGYGEPIVDGYNIVNPHEIETINVEGIKTWDDTNDQDGKRPTAITVNLWADGEKIDSREVTEESGWSWNFTNLPKYKEGAEGQQITYTITEDAVAEYSTVIEGYNITNSYTPGITSRTVNKIWVDGDNRDGIRPSSITVQLLADGAAYGDPIELNTENDWSYTWSDLPEKSVGNDIRYTVEEISNVAGYTTSYSEDTFIITNSHTPSPDPTPEPGTTPGPGTTPEPGNTPESGNTPGVGTTPVPTLDNGVLGASRVRASGLEAAVLGARRGTDYAVLGKRRRPQTGDSLALILWILALAAATGGAVASGVMMRTSGKENKKKS